MKYINYEITNLEPIRIADDSTSQRGQTATLDYIPGSTIRGAIINKLAKKTNFEDFKKLLFSADCRFLNAYRTATINGEKKRLIPSPKGFYEDKTEEIDVKAIENVVVDGKVEEGNKRAGLGRYVCFAETEKGKRDTVLYYGVKTGSDLKVTVNGDENTENALIRTEHICKGYTFAGSIAVGDEKIAGIVKEALKSLEESLIIGNARSRGMGKCRLTINEQDEEFPYLEIEARKAQKESCYMMLLSNMAMRNEYGEYVGINEQELGRLLGVEDLKIALCSTSTVNVMGYNRTWKGKIPSVNMYEKGSVFKLEYRGEITTSKIREIEDCGIGVRRNEGFGQILILDKEEYEQISKKKKGQEQEMKELSVRKREEDQEVLELIAKIYAKRLVNQAIQKKILENKAEIKGISNSQLGSIASIADSYRYNAESGISKLRKYLEHAEEKETEERAKTSMQSGAKAKEWIENVLEIKTKDLLSSKDEVMGFSIEELVDINSVKLKYISESIRYRNRVNKGTQEV